MREIGGYIEFETYYGKEYHDAAIALNSGRHCLEYLLRARKIKKLSIPYYNCDCIENVCRHNNVAVEYYHTGNDFLPKGIEKASANSWVYIVNYFGQLSNEEIMTYSKYSNIIVDNTQDFFRKPIKGIDTLYTCRKYFGVSGGGTYTLIQP